MKPDQIVSTMSYKGQTNTLALPDHANRIQIAFTPLFGAQQASSRPRSRASSSPASGSS